MNVFNWLSRSAWRRSRALGLYRQGMAKANKHNHLGAIEDYTSALRMRDVPPDVIAMVLYNRALVYVATGDDSNGTRDLESVLAMEESLNNIKSMAKQKLIRMKTRSDKSVR